MTTVLKRMQAFEVEDLVRGGNKWVKWGRIARDWQVADVEALADPEGPRWHFWCRPRGSSKSQDAGLFALACLLTIQPSFTVTHLFARDADQATIIFDKIAHLTRQADNLTVTGRRITNTDTGASIVVEGADAASSLGATPWGVICDELLGWPDTKGHRQLWANVLSGLGKRPDAWLLVISSAGDPASPFYEVFKTANATDDWRLAWLPGPPPFMSEATVARARRNLPESVFEWHYLNRFASPDNALANKDELDAAFAGAPTGRPFDPAQRYLVTADLSETHDATVLLVTHMEVGDVLVVDHMTRIKPSRLRPIRFPEVKRRIMSLSDEYGRAPIRADKSRAEQMIQEMREDGYLVEPYPFTVESNNQLTLALQRLVRERGLRLLDDADMRDEMASVFVQATSEGKVKIEHHSGRHNDIAITLAMAAHYWLSQPFRGARSFVPRQGWSEDAPRITRDTRANLPVGASRRSVSREDHARRTWSRLIHGQGGT